ncbi:K02A2.6-like, partial [Cordylochernes scorpioides]
MLYNLEKFEGKGIVPFTKFIKDFELVYDLRALDDARKIILLDNHLRGAAREFAFQSQQIRLGYEELKESLERRFRKRVSTREMRSQFFSCRQGAGEKVRDFAARVSDLAAGAESDGLKIGISEVAEVFIDGLCPSLWEKAPLYQGEPWETLVGKLQWLEQRKEDYREAQRSSTDRNGQRLGDMGNKLAELERKMKALETENMALRRQRGSANSANNEGRRWPTHPTGRGEYEGDNTEDNRRGAPFRNWQGDQHNNHSGSNGIRPHLDKKGGTPTVRRARTPHPGLPADAKKKLGPACLKAGGGFAASLPAINMYILNKERSLSERSLKFIIDSGSEANIVNIDSLKICTEGLNKPTYLKGITGKSLRSLGSEVLEIGATVNGKPIREVRTTLEYCHMGEIGFDGILGLPGFRALKLHLSYDGSVRSDYERKEDPTKSAFLSSLQTIEMSPQPPRIPLNKIHTGEDILRAFSHCFCRDIRDMGNGSTITAPKLKMLTSKPIYRRQYPIPNRLVSKVKTLVDELEEVGIIEGSTSLWNSPLFPVAKTDGSVRITMDLRLINEATEFFPFPIPRVEDNLRAFAGAKVFSTLDLTSGFFQIHILESDRDYFTVSLPWGSYRFTRLPQGAKNSAQVFQWAMNLVLGDLLFKCVCLYIDDVIVYSDSHEQHVADLAAVLERLSKFGLKAKYGKSYLFRDSVEYLGHVIDRNGIEPMWDNVAALRDLKRPHNIKAVRSLLGTVNYYRRFIPNAGEVLAPLSNLLRKGHRFAWGMAEQSAFETVKGILTSKPLLIHPTIGIPFILNTDASGIAVGACLQQEVNGTVRPIAYYSKRLTGPEIRYSTTEKEAYAVVLSLQHFKHLLVGSRVEVHTDHKPITYNKGSDYKNARLSRWAEIIQDFNVTFIYVPGKENTVADFLSRFPCEDDPNLSQDRRVVAAVVRDRRPPLLNSNQIWEGLLQEKGWAPVINRLTKLKSGSTERYNNREYRLQDKYLVTKNEKGTWVKVMRRLKGDYYWPGMRTQVRKYIRRCESCQLSNQGVAKAASAPHFRPEKPFEHIALDFIGPLETTPRGYSSILTIVDLFTKFPILIPTKDQCANTVVRALLERIITTFGVPKTILSDRGSAFMSCVFKGVCKAMGVGAVNTTAWRPQSNGAAERLNRTVIESLRRCTAGNNWDTTLPMVAFAIRTTVHASTGFTPAKLVFGHELRLPQPFQEEELNPICEDSITEMAVFYERELVEEVEKMREMVRQTYLDEQQEARAKFEARELRTFEMGDLVLVKRMHETKGRHKFEPRYRGPYEVAQRAGDTVYLLKDLETGNLDKIHIDKMKAYHAPVRTYPAGDKNIQEQTNDVINDEDHWVHPTYPIYSHRPVEPEEPQETAILRNPLGIVNRVICGNVGGLEIRRTTRVKKPTGFFTPDQDFEIFVKCLRFAFAANDTSLAKQVPVLLAVIGPKLFKLAEDLVAPEKLETKSFDEIVALLNRHLAPTPRVTPARYNFLKSSQEDETISQFMATLRGLAEPCKFGSMLNEMLRDKLVVGVRSENLQKRLLQEGDDATLDKIYEIALSYEAAERDLLSMKKVDYADANVHDVKKLNSACSHCAWIKATGKINVVEASENRKYFITLNVDNKNIQFEFDTGSCHTLMPINLYKKLWNKKISPINLHLKSYSNTKIDVIGKREVFVAEANKSLPLIITETNRPVLLGTTWIKCLPAKFLKFSDINSVQETTCSSLVNKFAEVFVTSNVGIIKDHKAHLILRKDANPRFFRARNVPYVMRNAIEKELKNLEAQGVITKIERSDWATPIVPIMKKNGHVRICGDFKITLNPVLKIDQYPLPKIEDIFAILGRGINFSKIDLSQAYLQLELDENSKEMAVINTHKGLYRYNRLPFGIASAPAIWQRIIEQILSGIPGTLVYLDDILITGESEADHLRNLEAVLNKLNEYGLKANREKCNFFQESLEYCGHVIDKMGLHKTNDKIRAVLEFYL